ncbi:MAG TPA: helix-turn-helix domain-containing protein [Virgibacillus sp.]|nr:helix-turn-helix domain-containing protein [Virgibacillus sp.]HLR67602.1 helix-turn-helix domain-containing protein [Virgibacillus sp.]
MGTTPETLSRRLTELEETGLIQQKGQRSIQVLDADALLLI